MLVRIVSLMVPIGKVLFQRIRCHQAKSRKLVPNICNFGARKNRGMVECAKSYAGQVKKVPIELWRRFPILLALRPPATVKGSIFHTVRSYRNIHNKHN